MHGREETLEGGAVQEEHERVQQNPGMNAAKQGAGCDAEGIEDGVSDCSPWESPTRGFVMLFEQVSRAPKKDVLAPGGEMFTLFEVLEPEDTCDLTAVYQAVLHAVLSVSKLNEEDKTRTVHLSDVACLILCQNYPRELFEEWIPMKDKDAPGFCTLAPDATRTGPSIRVAVHTELDPDSLLGFVWPVRRQRV